MVFPSYLLIGKIMPSTRAKKLTNMAFYKYSEKHIRLIISLYYYPNNKIFKRIHIFFLLQNELF